MGNQPGKSQHQNQSGRPKKNVTWKSAEPPSPPGRPMLIPLSDQQPDVVNLNWERPKLDGGSAITGYIVEHRRMGSPHWVRATPTPVSRCEVSISGLEPGWRYQFRVFAENVVGRSDASELSDALTVTLQRTAICVPNFIEELQDRQAVEDERIEFRVRVLGQPPPEINWFKDGYEIFSSRRTKILNDNDVSALIIHQVALTDEGEIKCTATNRAGHVVTKARLMVQAPPKIRLPRTYEDGLIVEANEVLRLKVGIAGQPPPAITWLHEGEVVPNGGRFEISNTDRNSLLKIDNIQRDDRGEYSVRAWNRLGEDVTSFLVTVTARPNPPGKVRLNMSFGKSATLSWTSPLDDGGCKIGYYIVEYFRVGWNVWLKAATTRSLSTTLHDLIEGSEYKFRVKAENPYGVSDPSDESDILFIPDPKRGITKPKSESKLAEEKPKPPTAPRRKPMSPQRSLQDAATETEKTAITHKPKPQLLDTEDLHREMSYGTSDKVLKLDVRRSPSMNTKQTEGAMQTNKPTMATLKQPTTPTTPPSPTKSPQRSPLTEKKSRTQFLQNLLPSKDKSPTPARQKTAPLAAADLELTPEKQEKPENPRTPEIMRNALQRKRSLSPMRRSPTPPETIKNTPALQRSAEPVQLDVNQHVRRYSGHALSPAKYAPSLAIAIATGTMGVSKVENIPETKLKEETNKKPQNLYSHNNKNNSSKNNSNNNNETNASNKLKYNSKTNEDKIVMDTKTPLDSNQKQNASTLTNPTIEISAPPQSKSFAGPPPVIPLSISEKQDDVHTSNEFMLVVFDKNSKVKDKDKQDSFELDLEEALQPPPISISSPDLASLELNVLHTFPMRRSVSSTELLYERAMARFYEAVELEEAEKARKLGNVQEREKPATSAAAAPPLAPATSGSLQPTFVRKRLGSMTEAERLSFERRSELRRQSEGFAHDFKTACWNSRENISGLKPLSRTTGMLLNREESQEYEDEGEGEGEEPDSEEASEYQARSAPTKGQSFELGSDYTDSTESSEVDSIEKFKMELMARTKSPSPAPDYLDTYHPRDMSAGVFTPYRVPTPDTAALVLNRPVPLPDPDFVPKPILKRPSNESVQPLSDSNQKQNDSNSNKNGNNSNKNDGGNNNKIIAANNDNIKNGSNNNNNNNDNNVSSYNEIIVPSVSNNNNSNNEKLSIAEGIKSFFKRDKRTTAEKNAEENANISKAGNSLINADLEAKRKAKEEEEFKRKEAERTSREEAYAVADHYNDLVRQVSSTRKYHTPLYLDKEGLKKAGGGDNVDSDKEDMERRRSLGTEDTLMPPMNNKPRLSISERGQLAHVRQAGSNLAYTEQASKLHVSDTPTTSDDNTPTYPVPAKANIAESSAIKETDRSNSHEEIISETVVERPDSRGRTRLVKVKRIIKKRVPSRSRDTSASRPPSSATSTQDIAETTHATPAAVRRRVLSRTRTSTGQSKSPGPLGRQPLPSNEAATAAPLPQPTASPLVPPSTRELLWSMSNSNEALELKSVEQLEEEAHEKVRSALSYSTDLVLFVVACYVYLFKDTWLVLPILALMIYRQLGDFISDCIPKWMKRKRN